MTTLSNAQPFCPGFDFTDPDLLHQRVPVEEFAYLRETAPVWWNDQPDNPFNDDGYWVVSRYEDVKAISRDCVLWSNNRNGAIMRLPEGMTAEHHEFSKAAIINCDGAEHARLRKLVSKLFTPRAVARIEAKLADAARDIVSNAAQRDSGDFVDDIAVHLPLIAIADLIGVPEQDRQALYRLTNAIMNNEDPEFAGQAMVANAELMAYAYVMAEERRRNPADDIITRLVQADTDGDALTEIEFGILVNILALGGNETARNAMTHGIKAFFEHPDQWELFKKERPATAVDEILRWSTPVHCLQRTATADVEIGGVTVREGQRVGLFYSSANFDDSVFHRPFEFDILRNPNPHLTFGGNGAHYCIGANLARLEIRLMFDEIANQLPDISKLAEPSRVRSGWINGIKHMDVKYR